MWKIFSISALLFLLGCSEDSGTGPGGDLGLGSFRVDIDGTRWNATQGAVSSWTEQIQSGSILYVTALKNISSTETETFGVTVTDPGNAGGLEGTFSLDPTGGAVISFVTINEQVTGTYFSVDGEITINDISSNSIKGVFNAVCVNSITLQDTLVMTNGAFNAPILPIP